MKNITKILLLMITFSMIFVLTNLQICAQENVTEYEELKIIIDGEKGTYEDVPLLVNNRTMLPLRAVVTKLGILNDDEHIIWNGDEQSVTLISGDTKVYLKVGSLIARVNGQEIVLDVAPFVYTNDRTYVPARFVSEAFGKKVLWDEEQKGVIISEYEEYNKIVDILEKSDAAMKDLSKFKTDIGYKIMSADNDENFDMSLNIKMEIDEEDYFLEMGSEMDIDMENASDEEIGAAFIANIMNISMYKVGDKTYTKMFLTGGQWIEGDESLETTDSDGIDLNMDTDFNELVQTNEFSSEVTASSMVLEESMDGLSYILKGDTYQDLLLGKSLENVDNDASVKFNDFYMELRINKETYHVEQVNFMVDFESEDGIGDIAKAKVDIAMSITDINGDFKIVVPDEVLNNLMSENDDDSWGFGGLLEGLDGLDDINVLDGTD